MELINEVDDLDNKNIEINNPSDISSTSSQETGKKSNAVQNFISGFKNFLKPKLTSTEIEKDNKENIESNKVEDSNRLTTSSKEEETKNKESFRDKIANKIIEKLEVERNILLFILLILIGTGLIIFSFFLLPMIIVSPGKFSFCFAVGSIFILISFLFLVGTRNYVNKILDNKRIFISISFILSIFIGIGFIIFSFFLFPLIVASPGKFSFCFAVGSIFILISFLFLVGTRNYVKKVLDNKRIFISISFILSIFIGIGFSLGHHYFISLFCSGVQLISMIMFILTFIPGGRAGIDCIKRTLSSPFTKLFINKAKSDLNEL